MTAVAESISLFGLFILGCFFGPADKAEFRVGIIEETGYVGTLIVRRTEDGFDLFSSDNGELRKGATVSRDAENEAVLIWEGDGHKERLDTAPLTARLKPLEDDRPQTLSLVGDKIKVSKSGGVIFVDQEGERKTLVIH